MSTGFTDFYDASQARQIAVGGGAPLGVVLTEINAIKVAIDAGVQGGITGLSVTGGNGYTSANNYALTASGGGGNGFSGLVDVVAGALANARILTPGVNYSTVPDIIFRAGGGIGGNIVAAIGILSVVVSNSTPMTTGVPYYEAWSAPDTFQDDIHNIARARMDSVVQYFSRLGYAIKRTQHGTGSTIDWTIRWR